VQRRDPGHPFGQLAAGEPVPLLVEHTYVVVVLGPVVPDEDQVQLLS
jgi:hypothetical protein